MQLGNSIDSLAQELLDKVLSYYRRPLNENDRDTILEMYAQGINMTHIALELGYSRYIIRSTLEGEVLDKLNTLQNRTLRARYSKKKSVYTTDRIYYSS